MGLGIVGACIGYAQNVPEEVATCVDEKCRLTNVGFLQDYRWQDYPARPSSENHPGDVSVQTYMGHKVTQTLIRCHFSPAFSTGQRYIYTGSTDEKQNVVIYDVLTGQKDADMSSEEEDEYEYEYEDEDEDEDEDADNDFDPEDEAAYFEAYNTDVRAVYLDSDGEEYDGVIEPDDGPPDDEDDLIDQEVLIIYPDEGPAIVEAADRDRAINPE
eukprot:scaffold1108_cov387-Prasinococcus_capsulatus_cf.AAC.3